MVSINFHVACISNLSHCFVTFNHYPQTTTISKERLQWSSEHCSLLNQLSCTTIISEVLCQHPSVTTFYLWASLASSRLIAAVVTTANLPRWNATAAQFVTSYAAVMEGRAPVREIEKSRRGNLVLVRSPCVCAVHVYGNPKLIHSVR